MADTQQRERLVRLSLREMLVLFALCATALVSLQFASAGWEMVVGALAALAFAAAVIVALVDRQAPQAFAIGFAVALAIYVSIVASQGSLGAAGSNLEMNPDAGKLPTTQLLRPLFAAVAETRWIDFRTGKEVPNYDPNNPDPNNPGPDMQYISMDERPQRGAFMRIGHCWWALVLGYLGGWFGRFVYLRRMAASTLASGRH